MKNLIANGKQFLLLLLVPKAAEQLRRADYKDVMTWDKQFNPDEATKAKLNAWMGENPKATKVAFDAFTDSLIQKAVTEKYPNAKNW